MAGLSRPSTSPLADDCKNVDAGTRPGMTGLTSVAFGQAIWSYRSFHSGCGQNQAHFPRARPMLDVVLTLNCQPDVVVLFEIDEAFDGVTFYVNPWNEPIAVLVDALKRDRLSPDVKDAIWRTGHEV